MEVGKSSHVNSRRSSVPHSSCPDEDLGEESHSGEDSQLEYLSACEDCVDDKNSSSDFPEQRGIGEGKDTALMGDKVPPQVTAGEEEECGKSDRPARSVSVKVDGPSLSPRGRAPAVAVQFCEHAEPSGSHSCEEPGAVSVGSTAKDAGTQFPVSEILPSKSPDFGVELADESMGGSPSCVSLEHRGALRSTASVPLITQAVDASPDFRSSSAQVCLCSRAINTEITMMNKSRPVGWPRQNCLDAASNTEWSFGAQSSHVQEQCTCEWKTGTDSGLSGEEKADFEAPELPEEETRVSRDKTQSDGGQASDSASPKTQEAQHKGRDLKCGYMKTEEGTEYWFDAKEDLTMSDFPVTPEETNKQQEKQGTGDSREVKTVQSKNEDSSVCVGGPSSSVSEDTGENSVQKTSASHTIDSSDIFNSPYALNLSSFTKLINKLQTMHPEASRDRIVEALQQVRKNNKGMLCGLSISTIGERTSAILRKSMPSSGQDKQ
ncbi:hypothetical protein WISP_53235 [Willisornis vidua]|uniref:TTC3/DZIP3/RBM44-like helical domain-containing protein n=1 Tax=Willisornis vidua TaxID=1566151 RepID=A0ABQ9DFU7_9PASS|nr:hypothetical protein WISP_53235 [Willisornis vidua]